MRGFQFFLAQKKLWKFVLIPLVINSLALILLISLYFAYFNDLFVFVTKPLGALDITDPQNYWWHFLDGLLWVARQLLQIVFILLSLVMIFVAVFLLSSLINSPFYESMAEKILILKECREDRPFTMDLFFKETVHSLKIELYKLVLFLSLTVVLVLFSFIPVVGLVFSLLAFIFTSWFFAFGLSAFPMVLDRLKFRQILRWGLNHKMALIGFGLPSMIPIIGLLLISFQVVGGTLLYIDNKNNV